MKTYVLMIAAALAAGTAFAATPDTPAQAEAATTTAAPAAPVKKSHKKVAKKKQAATHGTHAMGAGAASPLTDLQASSRQARIDQAYANWQSAQR